MKNKGFTLIEILVVLAIIGLLSTLAVIALNSARRQSYCEKKNITDFDKCVSSYEKHLKTINR